MFNGNRRPRGRNTRRPRRGGFRTRNRLFRKRLYNIKNTTVFRPRKSGYNNLLLSFTRRFLAYPSSGVKPSPSDPAPASSWWLDTLQWFGSLALQLIGIFLAGDDLRSEPAKFAITGAGTVMMLDPAMLLLTTSVASRNAHGTIVPYEQGRIAWVKATVSPIVDSGIVGGSYACALIPVDKDQSKADLPSTFEKISIQSGSVIRPMTKPVSVSWSPTVQEHSFMWHRLGDTGERKIQCLAFCIAFSDMALAKPDPGGKSSLEYNPGKSGFELYLDGQMQVRQPGISYISDKLDVSDASFIKLMKFERQHLVRFSDVEWKDGLGSVHPNKVIEILPSRRDITLDGLVLE